MLGIWWCDVDHWLGTSLLELSRFHVDTWGCTCGKCEMIRTKFDFCCGALAPPMVYVALPLLLSQTTKLHIDSDDEKQTIVTSSFMVN